MTHVFCSGWIGVRGGGRNRRCNGAALSPNPPIFLNEACFRVTSSEGQTRTRTNLGVDTYLYSKSMALSWRTNGRSYVDGQLFSTIIG